MLTISAVSHINTMQYTVDGEINVLRSHSGLLEATLNAFRNSFPPHFLEENHRCSCVSNAWFAPNVCAFLAQACGDHCNCVCVCQSSHTEESYTCAKEGFFFIKGAMCRI